MLRTLETGVAASHPGVASAPACCDRSSAAAVAVPQECWTCGRRSGLQQPHRSSCVLRRSAVEITRLCAKRWTRAGIMNNLTRAYVLEPSLPSASARDGIFERGSGASGMGKGWVGRDWRVGSESESAVRVNSSTQRKCFIKNKTPAGLEVIFPSLELLINRCCYLRSIPHSDLLRMCVCMIYKRVWV